MHRDHTPTGEPTVSAVVLPEFGSSTPGDAARSVSTLEDVPVTVSVIAGRARLSLGEVRALLPGSIVELDRLPEDSAEIFVNGIQAAAGDIVVVDNVLAARIGEFRYGRR